MLSEHREFFDASLQARLVSASEPRSKRPRAPKWWSAPTLGYDGDSLFREMRIRVTDRLMQLGGETTLTLSNISMVHLSDDAAEAHKRSRKKRYIWPWEPIEATHKLDLLSGFWWIFCLGSGLGALLFFFHIIPNEIKTKKDLLVAAIGFSLLGAAANALIRFAINDFRKDYKQSGFGAPLMTSLFMVVLIIVCAISSHTE